MKLRQTYTIYILWEWLFPVEYVIIASKTNKYEGIVKYHSFNQNLKFFFVHL